MRKTLGNRLINPDGFFPYRFCTRKTFSYGLDRIRRTSTSEKINCYVAGTEKTNLCFNDEQTRVHGRPEGVAWTCGNRSTRTNRNSSGRIYAHDTTYNY